jgi:hypothetical protein
MAILRALLSLLAGFLTMALPVGVITAVLQKRAPQWVGPAGQPRPAYIAVNLVYSLAAAIAGGFVSAWIGSDNPLRYALVLAIAVLLLGGMSAVHERGRQPVWYQILLVTLMPAGVILGGWLRIAIGRT